MAAAEEGKESPSPWLQAHEDPLAGLRCFSSSSMVLADLHGDGDNKLVLGLPLAPGGPRLAVLGGVGVPSTLPLPEAPCGLGVLGVPSSHSRGGSGPGGVPVLVVAAGSALYIYRNLRPFHKYSLPPRDPHPLEKELWLQAQRDQIDPQVLKEMLQDLRDKAQQNLSTRSLRLLALPPQELGPFVEQHKGKVLEQEAVVSCLGSLSRGGPEGAPECPIVGTEGGDILVLDPEAFTILAKAWVPSPAAFVAPRGPGDNRCRLAVACRDGSVWGTSRSRGRGRVLGVLGAPPVGLLAQDGGVLAATAQGSLQMFSPQGRRQWVLQVPGGGVVAVAGGSLPSGGGEVTLLALQNREVRFYRGRTLIHSISTQDVVTALSFGRFGREDGTLLMVTRGGSLSIRILRRRAELGGGDGPTPTLTPTQPPPLPLPPRTRLFVDRALREREEGARLHSQFQEALGRLRLSSARAWARALGGGTQIGGGANNDTPSVTASVQGLGPRLRLLLRLLLPLGGVPNPHLLLLLRCHPPPKMLQPPLIKVPLLVPGLSYCLGSFLELGDPPPAGGHLQVLLLREGEEEPMVTLRVGVTPTQ